VGGAVRDLALGREPREIDMVSAARPEEVEASFERTLAVGRAFGTLIVQLPGLDVELTTFRTEAGYSDARRPDRVEYGATPEEDATRRDFTCNALYLDPLADEVRDPTGGLADLEAGVLRTVGDPGQRFAEDGLRLLRMARFEADLELAPAPGLHAAATESLGALRGVSVERVLHELRRLFAGRRAAHGLAVLDAAGVLEVALPGWRERAAGPRPWDEVQALRLCVARALPDVPGALLGFATLFEVDPLGEGGEASLRAGSELLCDLHASRELVAACAGAWRARRALAAAARAGAPRAQRIRALRAGQAAEGLVLARAWAEAQGSPVDVLERLAALERFGRSLAPRELRPERLLAARDLEAAGVPRGPRWSALFEELETAQLEGAVRTQGEALAWLLERARQDGGKTRRSANDAG